jgi:hypothetical protein
VIRLPIERGSSCSSCNPEGKQRSGQKGDCAAHLASWVACASKHMQRNAAWCEQLNSAGYLQESQLLPRASLCRQAT